MMIIYDAQAEPFACIMLVVHQMHNKILTSHSINFLWDYRYARVYLHYETQKYLLLGSGTSNATWSPDKPLGIPQLYLSVRPGKLLLLVPNVLSCFLLSLYLNVSSSKSCSFFSSLSHTVQVHSKYLFIFVTYSCIQTTNLCFVKHALVSSQPVLLLIVYLEDLCMSTRISENYSFNN